MCCVRKILYKKVRKNSRTVQENYGTMDTKAKTTEKMRD